MVKEITCDICGIKMGSQYEQNTVTYYPHTPQYRGFFADERHVDDICNNCEEKFREAIKRTYDMIKNLKEKQIKALKTKNDLLSEVSEWIQIPQE